MRVLRLPRGFTLVEVLVATALLSLVMLGLLTAMRSFAQSETRIDERIRIDDDLRSSDRFLRSVMAVISPRPRFAAGGASQDIDFAGGADDMRWIGVMPARHGAGGLYRFHLYGRPSSADGPAALVLEFSPFIPGFEAPLDAGSVQSRTMATPIREVRLRYQDNPESGEEWLAGWPHADRLPRRIGLTVVSDRLPWPEMIVSVAATSGPRLAGSGGVEVGPVR